MVITIYKNKQKGICISRKHDLTNCLVEELTKALNQQCEEINVNPVYATVVIPEKRGQVYYENVIKSEIQIYSMEQVAKDILLFNWRRGGISNDSN